MTGLRSHKTRDGALKRAARIGDSVVGRLVDAAGALVAVVDPNGRILWNNDTFARFSGAGDQSEPFLWPFLPTEADVCRLQDDFVDLRNGATRSTARETGWRSANGSDRRIHWTYGFAPEDIDCGNLIVCIGIDVSPVEEKNCAAPRTTEAELEQSTELGDSSTSALRDAKERLEREIEQRKKTEVQLAEREAFVTSILDNLPHMIFVKDAKELRFVKFNRVGEKLLGRKFEDMVGRNDFDFFPKEQAEFFTNSDHKVLETGKLLDIPEELITTANGKRWLHTKKIPINNENGEPAFLLGISEDITDRKQAEFALQESEERFRSVFESSAIGIALEDENGRFLECNPAMCGFLGFDHRELVGRTYVDISREADIAESVRLFEDFRDGKMAKYSLEKRYVRRDGSVVWGRVTVSKFGNKKGEEPSVIAMLEDITERKEAENALMENEHRLRDISENIQDVFWMTSPDGGRAIYINPAFETVWGRNRKSWYNDPRSLIEAIHPEDRARVVEAKQRMRDAEFDEEYRILRPDQSQRWVRDRAFPILDENGNLIRVGGVATDITKLKLTEMELIAAKEDAEKATAAKSRFLAAASHDLRQPLQALGLLIAALRETSTSAENRETLGDVSHAYRVMGEMLNSLLDFSRLDAGIVAPEFTSFPVNDLLDQARRMFDRQAAERGLDLRTVPCSLVVRSDPALLGRIIENLVSNAARYTQRGKILLGCRRHGNKLRIEVWDTGIGIPESKLESIFEEYYQLGNPIRDRDRGLGLGLALVRRLVRILNHRVETKSVVGKGSMFAVEAPIGTGDKGHSEERKVERILGPTLENVTVALVEDDDLVVSATRRLLKRWGARVIAAKTSREAVRQCKDEDLKPELVIADYSLPGGENGAEAIERIRTSVDKTMPAVVVTGDISPKTLREIRQKGLTVLHKPIEPAKLRSLIRHLRRESVT